jgi:hypothetical protein
VPALPNQTVSTAYRRPPDEVFGPIADISAVRATTRNDSASFEMVQFMATAGGLDAWFFNALPSASIFQFSSERAWHHGTKKNHSGGDESFDIRTVFSQVVEFEDVDGDGAFDKKHDKVLQRCRLNEADFSAAAGGFPDPFQPAFQQTKITFPGTNVSGYKLSTKGKLGQKVWPPHGPWPGPGPKPKPHGGGGGDDNDCAGTVQIDYFLTTAAAFDGEVYLSPTSTKFAFSVDGFKYVKPKPPPPAPNGSSSNTSTPETLLALKMFVLSQTIQSDWEFHARGSDHGNMPNIASRTKDKTRQGGFFSWNGTYAGDGRYHEIKTTYAVTTDGGGDFDIASDQTAAELWFTFSGGQHASISWDPSTGYGDLGESSGVLTPASIVGIVLGSLAAVGLVGAATVYGVRKYRRGKKNPGSPGLGDSNSAAGYGAI